MGRDYNKVCIPGHGDSLGGCLPSVPTIPICPTCKNILNCSRGPQSLTSFYLQCDSWILLSIRSTCRWVYLFVIPKGKLLESRSSQPGVLWTGVKWSVPHPLTPTHTHSRHTFLGQARRTATGIPIPKRKTGDTHPDPQQFWNPSRHLVKVPQLRLSSILICKWLTMVLASTLRYVGSVLLSFFFTKGNVCLQLLPACRSLEIQRLSFSTLCPLGQAFCNSSNIIFFKNILVSLNHNKVYSIKQKTQSHNA